LKNLKATIIVAAILAGYGPNMPLAVGQSRTAKDVTLDDIFPADRVLDVQITVEKEDWDTIRLQSRNFFEALQPSRQFEPPQHPYTYVNAKVKIDGVEFPNVGLRKKGFIGSQNADRPSLKIKLNHVDKKNGIDGLKMLTFNNNQQDVSQVSQVMGYALFNQVGAPAPRCCYAKITVNGKSLGIYSHVESVRQPMMQRCFGNDSGTLYEGTVVDFHEAWEDSFEKKFGKDKRARKKIKQLIDVLNGREGRTLLDAVATVRAWVPTDDRHDDKWTALGFDDSSWKEGQTAAGFEIEKRSNGSGPEQSYESLIGQALDFGGQMYNRSSSLYLRLPFDIDDMGDIGKGDLTLRMKYDDGFVAYLNGHEIASVNAPPIRRWDSHATAGHEDAAARKFESINVTTHKDKLRKGRNVLAIHGMNIDVASPDLLFIAELQSSDTDIENAIAELVDLDSFYKFWAVEGLIGFWDGYSGNNNNFFVYLSPETDKFHFIPWGADAVFEKFSKLEYDPRAPISVKTKGLVAHKLYQLESGRTRYRETMLSILEEHWDEKALIAESERIEEMLAPHLARAQRGTAQGMLGIRLFMRLRRQEIVAEISDGMPIWTAVPDPPFVMPGEANPQRQIDKNADSIWNVAKAGKIDALRELIEKGVDLEARDGMGITPLGWAAIANQLQTAELLIAEGASVNGANRDGSTPLHSAAFLGNVKVASLLVEKKANVNALNARRETPLATAAQEWNDEIASIVGFIGGALQIKIDIDDVEAGRPRVAELLRKNGGKRAGEVADNPANKVNLGVLIKAGNIDELRKALTQDVDLNAQDDKGVTPLAWTALANTVDAAQLLIEKGAKLDARNQDGSPALQSAAFLGRIEIVELLLENGASVNSMDNEGQTPLGTAAQEFNGQMQRIVRSVAGSLQLRIDIDEVEEGRAKTVELLLKHGGKTGEQLR
jgi:ankyrin repeat protein/spore coat protein CotH